MLVLTKEIFFLFLACSLISCMVVNARIQVFSENSSNPIDIEDKEASFGSVLPSDGTQGLLVIARPLNACTPIIPVPRIFPYDFGNFFALVEESSCGASKQALMAQTAGYKSIIVYRKNSNEPTKLSGGQDADNIKIPCLSVGKSSGTTLKKYDYITKTKIKLYPSYTLSIGLYLIPFLVVFGVCFLFMAVFSTARYCRYRSTLKNSRLSKSSLKCIPTKKFKKGDEYDICAICLDEFEVGDKLRILPCSHVYHCKCIDPWLTGGKKSCPVCNRKVSVNKQSRKRRRTKSTPPLSSPNNEHSEVGNEDGAGPNERTPLIAAQESNVRRSVVVDV